MSWDLRFINDCGKRVLRPRYILESVPLLPGGPIASISSHSHRGWPGFPAEVTRASSLSAGSLTIGSWSYTTGSMSVGLRARSDPRLQLPRGSLVRLQVGFPGYSTNEYETVWIGQVQDVTRGLTAAEWTVSVKSIVGSLVSRFTRTVGETPLFYELPATTTIATSNYVAGVSTVLNLASTTGLRRLTGGTYLVRVTPNSGDPFYLTSPTLVGSQLQTVTGGEFGTVDADANIGQTVEFLAYFDQNPVEAALTMLTSTGLGTNGAYDLGHASWGLGLPVAYVDTEDAAITAELVRPGLGTFWDIYTDTAQADASSYLRTVLQSGGIWLAERQGCVTVRAVEAPGAYSYGLASIYDNEIIELRYNTFDPSVPAEYGNFITVTASGGSSSPDDYDTRPALEEYELDFTGIVNSNQSNWRTRLATRLGPWYTFVGEAFEITLRGWRLAHLSPGDAVIVSSRFLSVRAGIEGVSLVTSVQVDWFGATTTLRCVHAVNQGEYL